MKDSFLDAVHYILGPALLIGGVIGSFASIGFALGAFDMRGMDVIARWLLAGGGLALSIHLLCVIANFRPESIGWVRGLSFVAGGLGTFRLLMVGIEPDLQLGAVGTGLFVAFMGFAGIIVGAVELLGPRKLNKDAEGDTHKTIRRVLEMVVERSMGLFVGIGLFAAVALGGYGIVEGVRMGQMTYPMAIPMMFATVLPAALGAEMLMKVFMSGQYFLESKILHKVLGFLFISCGLIPLSMGFFGSMEENTNLVSSLLLLQLGAIITVPAIIFTIRVKPDPTAPFEMSFKGAPAA